MTTQPFTPELALDLWYLALAEEIGIVIPIPDPNTIASIQNRIWEARKDVGDPRLAGLYMHTSQDGSTLYIQKKEVELD